MGSKGSTYRDKKSGPICFLRLYTDSSKRKPMSYVMSPTSDHSCNPEMERQMNHIIYIYIWYIYINWSKVATEHAPKTSHKRYYSRDMSEIRQKKTLPNSCNFMSNIFVEKPEASSCFPSFCLIKWFSPNSVKLCYPTSIFWSKMSVWKRTEVSLPNSYLFLINDFCQSGLTMLDASLPNCSFFLAYCNISLKMVPASLPTFLRFEKKYVS